jgi:chitodextrinase
MTIQKLLGLVLVLIVLASSGGLHNLNVQAVSPDRVDLDQDTFADGVRAQSTGGATVASSLINPESDLEYLGAFRLPDEESNGTSWSYGGHGMGYYPNGDPSGAPDGYPGSLFSISHPYQNYVSEFSIPVPVISPGKDVDDLPVAATLQPFADVTGGRQTGGLTGTTLGDIQYYPKQGAQATDKLYWVMYEYYLPDPDEVSFGWSELDFSDLQSQGLWRLDDFPFAATSKYLFDIPASWADVYTPGKYLAAGRCRIVNDGSWGPALYAFGPWNDGNPPLDGSSTGAVELLKYGSALTLKDFSHSDEWNDGAWLTVGDKSAVILAGTKALRTSASGAEYYGEPEVDGCGYKGYHAEPYYGRILFYDTYLLAAVAQGTLQPHEVQPYAALNVEDYLFEQGCRRTILGGVAYDRQRGLLYVMEKGVEGVYAKKPIVHVWRATDQGQAPDRTAPGRPANLQITGVTSATVDLAWNASHDDVHLVGYIVYRNGAPVATTVETSFSDTQVNPGVTYTYTLQAWDASDNRSDPSTPLVATTLFGADTRAPIMTDIRVTGITSGSAVLSWKTDEPATTRLSYEITYSGDTTIVEDTALVTSHRVVLTGLVPDNSYSYQISSADATGNGHEYAHKGFVTPPEGGSGGFAPVLNGIGAQRVYEGELLQFRIGADDEDSDTLTYSVTDLPPGASFDVDTQEFGWVPDYDDAGVYRVTFTVGDENQSDDEQVAIFVLDAADRPLELRSAPGDRTIHLSWTVNTTLPVTSTWQIDYHSQTGTLYTPITGVISPTCAYTLTGLANYVWYTVTLSAMLDSTAFLSDTVRAMPTDIFVYLPLVLRVY